MFVRCFFKESSFIFDLAKIWQPLAIRVSGWMKKKSPQKVQIQMKIVSNLWRCLISSWSCKTRVVAMGNFCFWLAETFKIVSTKISIISPIKQREIYYFTWNFVPLLLINICKTNLVFFLSRLIFSMWVHHL